MKVILFALLCAVALSSSDWGYNDDCTEVSYMFDSTDGDSEYAVLADCLFTDNDDGSVTATLCTYMGVGRTDVGIIDAGGADNPLADDTVTQETIVGWEYDPSVNSNADDANLIASAADSDYCDATDAEGYDIECSYEATSLYELRFAEVTDVSDAISVVLEEPLMTSCEDISSALTFTFSTLAAAFAF